MRTTTPFVTHIRPDLMRRVELVSMDRYFAEVTIGLYRAPSPRDATAIVHSYSGRPGTTERLQWIAHAMAVLGGLRFERDGDAAVSFPCGVWHELAMRRIFLEAAKLDPAVELGSRGLLAEDTRRGFRIHVEPLGSGRYRVTAHGGATGAADPAASVAAGLAKLAEVRIDSDDATIVAFHCEADHDPLVGVLLPRALNVRAVLREEEMAANRGLLVAPSAQEAVS